MTSQMPPVAADGRAHAIALVALAAIGQALAAGTAAFATRDVFAALREPAAELPLLALVQIALAGAVIAVLRVAERVSAERLGQGYAGRLRMQLFSHLARLPARTVGERRAGALAMRFVGDLAAVRHWVSRGVARLISVCVVLPAATTVLFLLEPRLGAAVLIPLGLGLIALGLAAPRLGPAHRALRMRRARLAADMLERVPHAPELRLLGRVDIELAQMARRTAALLTSAQARAAASATLKAIPDLIAGAAAASLLLTALLWQIPAAEAAGALAALGLMIHPLRDLCGVWDRWLAWQVARDRCESLLGERPIERQMRQDALGHGPSVHLRLRGLGAGSLADRDLEACPGQKIAIVGANGSGKSSLLRLMAGLEQTERGRVALDGIEPCDLDARERRRTIAWMSTCSPILAGSLRRALTMGAAARRTDEDILRQAKDFGLGDVLQRLGGLDGRLAEGGRNLSAGEARRVLLTRVALSQARLLLLDEPDDLLDTDGVEQVINFLQGCDATVLVVTHNLALARRMDHLWFIEHGHVIEAGPSASVLQGDGPTALHFRPLAVA